ncbi:MAG: DUF6268 family outer membrane beta-barrel protein [Verrucomicrobiota bacterium]
MKSKLITLLAVSTLGVLFAEAQEESAGRISPGLSPGEGFSIADFIDATTLSGRQVGGMDLDNSPADFDFTEYRFTSFFTKPINLWGDWQLMPWLDLRASQFDFGGNPLIGSLRDDIETDLFHIGLPMALYHFSEGSRWAYGAFVNPTLSSDFDHVNSDDFFLDAALAFAYQWNDCLWVGAGIYVGDMLDDPFFIGGAGFIWVPDDNWLVSFYGPRFVARRDLGERHQLGFEVSTNGGDWNVDAGNISSKVEFNSWRGGLFYRYNLTGELWLKLGGGMTFGNELNFSTREGTGLFQNRLGEADAAPYAFVSLSMARW